MSTPPVDPMISSDAKCSNIFSNTLKGSISQQRSMGDCNSYYLPSTGQHSPHVSGGHPLSPVTTQIQSKHTFPDEMYSMI